MDSHTQPDNVVIGYYNYNFTGGWYCCQRNRFNCGWFPDGYLHKDGVWRNRCGNDGYFPSRAHIRNLLKKLYGEDHNIGFEVKYRPKY